VTDGRSKSLMETFAHQSKSLPGEGRPVRVAVHAELDSFDKVTFRLDSELIEGEDDGGGLIFDQDRDEMRKHDYYLVEFALKDRTRRGLKFAPDIKEAFWVKTGPIDEAAPPCPTSPSYDEEIHAIKVDDDTLIVRNENNTIVNFAYSLGFLARNGNMLRLDPVGSNKDGGS